MELIRRMSRMDLMSRMAHRFLMNAVGRLRPALPAGPGGASWAEVRPRPGSARGPPRTWYADRAPGPRRRRGADMTMRPVPWKCLSCVALGLAGLVLLPERTMTASEPLPLEKRVYKDARGRTLPYRYMRPESI